MLAAMSRSVRGLPCGVPNKPSSVCTCKDARIAAMIFQIQPASALRPCVRHKDRGTVRLCPDVFLKHKLYSALLWKLHEALLGNGELVVNPLPSQASCSL